eukprot:TRINITY_DN43089_c0_g1_i1.p1 TRINITY_DN43089_c0_g1~~TRINITY_DN43089_c0_g1_i1.p1  ORF type:complete len:399 (+),score=93.34 TRINITY_DN43089_c0_g1_i1:88-1284(+)
MAADGAPPSAAELAEADAKWGRQPPEVQDGWLDSAGSHAWLLVGMRQQRDLAALRESPYEMLAPLPPLPARPLAGVREPAVAPGDPSAHLVRRGSCAAALRRAAEEQAAAERRAAPLAPVQQLDVSESCVDWLTRAAAQDAWCRLGAMSYAALQRRAAGALSDPTDERSSETDDSSVGLGSERREPTELFTPDHLRAFLVPSIQGIQRREVALCDFLEDAAACGADSAAAAAAQRLRGECRAAAGGLTELLERLSEGALPPPRHPVWELVYPGLRAARAACGRAVPPRKRRRKAAAAGGASPALPPPEPQRPTPPRPGAPPVSFRVRSRLDPRGPCARSPRARALPEMEEEEEDSVESADCMVYCSVVHAAPVAAEVEDVRRAAAILAAAAAGALPAD